MQRREFLIVVISAAAAWPFAAFAQQPGRMRRIALLVGSSEPVGVSIDIFRGRLEELGWKPEGNVRLDVRYGGGSADKLRLYAAELLVRSADVIFLWDNLAVDTIRPLAGNAPIVFVAGDPVGSGFVSSLARPGGNITGFETFLPSIGGKWLQLLKDAAPHVTRALVIMHPETAAHQAFWHSMQEAATYLKMEVTAGGVHDAAEIETAISSFAAQPNGGVVSLPSATTESHNDLIVSLERQHRLPSVHAIANGSLITYTIDVNDLARRAAEYVDRILRGTKPADLPVQAPTRFKLIVN